MLDVAGIRWEVISGRRTFVPEGHPTIAQRFSVGNERAGRAKPASSIVRVPNPARGDLSVDARHQLYDSQTPLGVACRWRCAGWSGHAKQLTPDGVWWALVDAGQLLRPAGIATER